MLFSQKILNWFHIYGRKNLPWQKKNIYLIWISEVMLQRTQVKTVIPYFKKFKKKFPNLQVLAFAHIDEILYLWSGLGYYQRAYNIHKTAIIIQNAYNGIFPNNFNEILKLPGIGKSTTGAILSFAYNFGYAILDCNIKRILIRYHNINTDHKKKNQLELMLWSLINNYLPIHQSRAFNQAMMDIGALICTHRNPQCNLCPLKNSCLYYQNPVNLKQKIYYKKNKIGILFSIIEYNNQYLLKQYNQISIWKGLFYFPITFFSISDTTWRISKKKINNLNIEINPFIHYISNTKLYIYSHLININKKILHTDINQKRIWYNFYKTKKFGIPAPVRKILKLIQNNSLKKNMKKKNIRIIFCSFLQKNAEGLDYPFFTGQTGKKIYQEISKEAWCYWLTEQTKIINEKKLNMFIKTDRTYIKNKMKKFLFTKK